MSDEQFEKWWYKNEEELIACNPIDIAFDAQNAAIESIKNKKKFACVVDSWTDPVFSCVLDEGCADYGAENCGIAESSVKKNLNFTRDCCKYWREVEVKP